MQQVKRVIVALPVEEYRQLVDIASREVREPDQQAAYYVRAMLNQQPKEASNAGTATG